MNISQLLTSRLGHDRNVSSLHAPRTYSGLLCFFCCCFFSLLRARILRATASRKSAEYICIREKFKHQRRAKQFLLLPDEFENAFLFLTLDVFSARACPVLAPKGLIVECVEARVLGYQTPYLACQGRTNAQSHRHRDEQ